MEKRSLVGALRAGDRFSRISVTITLINTQYKVESC